MLTHWLRKRRALLAYLVIVIAVAASDAGYVRLESQRQHDGCVSRQHLYDGLFTYSHFLGRELDATPARVAVGLEHLRATLGPRPEC